MTDAAVILGAGGGVRFDGPGHKLRADLHGRPVLLWTVEAALEAGFDEVVVVVGDDPFADLLPESVTPVESPDWSEGQAHSLRAAVAHAESVGHRAIVVGLGDQPLVPAEAWRLVGASAETPISVATFRGARRPPTRLASSIWPSLPSVGDEGARLLLTTRSELVTEVPCPGDPIDVDTVEALAEARQRIADRDAVTRLLGREPMGAFDVVVRDPEGEPIVLRNHPLLYDGRPMPTLYWLCGARESALVGRLESMRGVRRAEEEVGLERTAEAHDRYRLERDRLLSGQTVTHSPSGGVGGTRTGVKCLHAHYAWWLAGGDDPVGQWVADHLAEVDVPNWPSPAAPETEEIDD